MGPSRPGQTSQLKDRRQAWRKAAYKSGIGRNELAYNVWLSSSVLKYPGESPSQEHPEQLTGAASVRGDVAAGRSGEGAGDSSMDDTAL